MTHKIAMLTKALIFRTNLKQKEQLSLSPTSHVVFQFRMKKVHLFCLYSFELCHACGVTFKVGS